MDIRIGRAVGAGIIGTLVMTAVGVWIGPLVGIPPMNPAVMLAGAMGGNLVLGWAGHLMIGITLAIIYAIVASWLPGTPPVRGALFGVAPYLLAQVVVIPMMGMPLFSGSAVLAIGSLIGHLAYGAVVGGVYGAVPSRATANVNTATAR